MHAIVERSFILEHLLKDGKIGIVGGMHELGTGRVEFYDDCMVFSPDDLAKIELR